MKKQPNFFPLVFLLFAAIIAYWQISFFQYSLKWDMLDAVLPFRYFLGECLQNNTFPFWNPYQMMGVPVYADMQYPVFYPEVWVVGKLFGYTNLTLHILWVFYLFIAAYGMYRLALYFVPDRPVALITGLAYMYSGFFVGHGQAMFAVISAAWLPYVLLHYFRMVQEGKWSHALAASIFMFFMIANGYQTFTIILGYFLLTIFVFFLVRMVKRKQKKLVFKAFRNNLIFSASTVLLSLPLIISLLQVAPFASRLSHLSFEQAMMCPLSPQSLISWLVPFGVVKETGFFNTDLSMTNAYFGIIMLVFFVFAIFRKKTAFDWLLLIWGVFALLAAFGEYTPLRAWLYHYVPLMGLFRSPSYFSLFSIIFFLLLAAKSLANADFQNFKDKKHLIVISSVIILILVAVWVYSVPRIYFRKMSFLNGNLDWFSRFEQSSIYENLFVHALVQLLVLAVFVFLLLQKRWRLRSFILPLVFVEMFVAVQLNTPYTLSSTDDPLKIKNEIGQMPEAFPIPADTNLADNTDVSKAFWPLWRNTHIFHKEVSPDGFTSFALDAYLELVSYYPAVKSSVLQNPLIYTTDMVVPDLYLEDGEMNPGILFLPEKYYEKYHDKVGFDPAAKAKITSFNPDEIKLKVVAQKPQMLVLQQNYYDKWHAYVDGKETGIIRGNHAFMSVYLPAGEHEVVFEIKNRIVIIVFIISQLCLLGLLLFFTIRFCHAKRYHRHH